METYSTYKGFGIRYNAITKTTTVEDMGHQLINFSNKGRIKGNNLAKYLVRKHQLLKG